LTEQTSLPVFLGFHRISAELCDQQRFVRGNRLQDLFNVGIKSECDDLRRPERIDGRAGVLPRQGSWNGSALLRYLLIFLLKGAMPEKYKDRVEQDIKGKGILGGLSDEELERIAPAVAAAELLEHFLRYYR